MKRIATLLLLLVAATATFAQAKKPTIMVVPADVWCTRMGYMTDYDDQGTTVAIPDYRRALQEDADLYNVITKIGAMMADRGLPLKDLQAQLKSVSAGNAELALLQSKTSGASARENPIDLLRRTAKADIIVEVEWKINTVGPKKSVTYAIRGIDAYTDKQVAGDNGTGAQSFSAEVPVLVEEAVQDRFDTFVAQLQAHFDDLLTNGREVTLDINVFDNASFDLEEEYDGTELTEIIENWMAENTVNHRFSTTDATENMMLLEQVRIPLYKASGAAQDTRGFASELRKYLKATYGIESKLLTKGLGRCRLVLGEK